MPSLKASARERVSTPDSVRRLLSLIAMRKIAVEDQDRVQEVLDAEIDGHIIRQQEIPVAALSARYGGTSALKVTAWQNMPLSVLGNRDRSNRLIAATLASGVITEQWIVECTISNSTFSVTGSISGAQSTGTFAADYAPTGADISIPTANWIIDVENPIEEGDLFIFSVFLYSPLIVLIIDYLSAAAVLEERLSDQLPNASDLSDTFYKRAMSYLDKLLDPTSGWELTTVPELDVDPVAVLYDVNRLGIDDTEYLPHPDTTYRFRSDNIYPPSSGEISRWTDD